MSLQFNDTLKKISMLIIIYILNYSYISFTASPLFLLLEDYSVVLA